MTLFRIAFLILAVAAVAGATYVSYYGIGRESSDVRQSVRQGSSGGFYAGGRVK